MAKGQKKSNKEIRKPKASKVKAPATTLGGFTTARPPPGK